MDKNKKPTRVAIAGIKGGTGKSTIAMILGVLARELYNKKVCMVDCDEYLSTLTDQRKAEELFLINNPTIVAELKETRDEPINHTSLLPVEKIKTITEGEIKKIEELHPDCDLFIYDTKGSEGEPNFFLQLTAMDYIILPIILDNLNAKPSYMWIKGMNLALQLEGIQPRTKGVSILFNKYSVSDVSQQGYANWWKKTAEEEHIHVFKASIFHSPLVDCGIEGIKSSNDRFFKSLSIIPEKSTIAPIGVDEVVKEIITFIDGQVETPTARVEMRPSRQRTNSSSDTLQRIDEWIKRLNTLAEKIRRKQLSAIQRHSIDEWFTSVDVAKLDELMSDPPMYFPSDEPIDDQEEKDDHPPFDRPPFGRGAEERDHYDSPRPTRAGREWRLPQKSDKEEMQRMFEKFLEWSKNNEQ